MVVKCLTRVLYIYYMYYICLLLKRTCSLQIVVKNCCVFMCKPPHHKIHCVFLKCKRRAVVAGDAGTRKCHQVGKKLISLRPGLISWSNASDRWHCVLCLSLHRLWSILSKRNFLLFSAHLPQSHDISGRFLCLQSEWFSFVARACHQYVSRYVNRCAFWKCGAFFFF